MCWSAIRKISAEDSLYQEMFSRLSSEGHVSRLVSAYHFEKDGTLQSLIHYLKYGGITALGVELGRRLGDCVQATLGGVLISGILPVPLHPTKRRERGYNQEPLSRRKKGLHGVLVSYSENLGRGQLVPRNVRQVDLRRSCFQVGIGLPF